MYVCIYVYTYVWWKYRDVALRTWGRFFTVGMFMIYQMWRSWKYPKDQLRLKIASRLTQLIR